MHFRLFCYQTNWSFLRIIILGYTQNFSNAFDGTTTRISDIGYAFYGGLWAYDGWNNLNYAIEELESPLKNLPRSIILGLPLVIVCYVLVIVAYLTVIPFEVLSSSTAVAVVSHSIVMYHVANHDESTHIETYGFNVTLKIPLEVSLSIALFLLW